MNEQYFTRGAGYSYIVFTPLEPFVSEKDWPLILFLHGAGERGNDLHLVKRQGLPRMLAERKTFSFITVAPQCPADEYWLPSMVEEVIAAVSAKYRIDQDRIYLTGISMGGYAAWITAMDFPDRFAAIAPVCGGGDPERAALIKDLPVWAFHGAKDPVVPVAETEAMVDALRRIRGNVRFTRYPEGLHDVWTETYRKEDLYAWFLLNDRNARRYARRAS